MADDEPRRRRRRSHRRRRSSNDSLSGSSSRKSRSRRTSSGARSRSFDAEHEPLGASNTFAWAVATGIYWLFLLFVMHSPSAFLPGDFVLTGDFDHWLHGIAYFGFAFLLCRTAEAWWTEPPSARNPPLWVYAAMFFGCVVYGYFDEQTQPLTGRTREASDWEADILGALAGVVTCLVIQIFFVVESRGPSYDAVSYEHGDRKRRRRRRRHRHHRRRRHSHRDEGPGSASPQDSSAPKKMPEIEPKPDVEPPSGEASEGEASPRP